MKMTLTPEDVKLLEAVRKSQRQWRVQRWLYVANGIIWISLFFPVYSRLMDFVKEDPPWIGLLLCSMILPVLFPWLFFSAYQAGQAIAEWKGKPERRLLIRLAESMQRNEAPNNMPDATSEPAPGHDGANR